VCWIVEFEGINRLYFKASKAARFHLLELVSQFRLRHCGAEPPPAHHYSRIVGRSLEGPEQLRIGLRVKSDCTPEQCGEATSDKRIRDYGVSSARWGMLHWRQINLPP
jgi:hypothetical protein